MEKKRDVQQNVKGLPGYHHEQVHDYLTDTLKWWYDNKRLYREWKVIGIGFRHHNTDPKALQDEEIHDGLELRLNDGLHGGLGVDIYLHGDKIGFIQREDALRVRHAINKYGPAKLIKPEAFFEKAVSMTLIFEQDCSPHGILPKAIADVYVQRQEMMKQQK